MKNTTKNIIALIILGFVFFFFKDQIKEVFLSIRGNLFPCSFPITYSLGEIDERFEISQEGFLSAIKEAEDIWETPVGKNIFEYKPKGGLKINLIYDNRQEITEKLDSLDFKIEEDKNFYTNLVAEYEKLKNEYFKEKQNLEIKIISFQNRQEEYQKGVALWNSRGGAPKKEFDFLSNEAEALKNLSIELNNEQAVLNHKREKLNLLVNNINNFVAKINGQAKNYNNISEELGEEFEEGIYIKDKFGRRINIYQFDDQNNLVRLLAHEFGHALSIEHTEDPNSLMYRLNVGGKQELSQEDILALKKICKIQ